ncbi:hypothetical protein ET445_16855 [Agromyces protaetiae]|uniref:Uncharacterized protein n=1 Tax=Agromyces protaetiae TaxID=2509455 RepID=A0A4P6FFS8_9MICO|nr:hypothetical protein [Agromyces protaetiae]QAY74755.1 hypothetical protein ET445_16855 [Agromyces protaetiae]
MNAVSVRRSCSVLGAIALLLTAAGCADGASGPSPSPTASEPEEPPDVDIGELGAESIEVEPFGDFLMSSGDLVWVSGVAPGIVAYDDTMSPVFQVETGTVWSALEFGHGYIWAAEAADDLQATALVRIAPADGTAVRFAVPSPGVPQESSIAVTEDAVWAGIPPAADGAWSLVGLDPESGAVVHTFDAGSDAIAAVRGGFGSLWVTRPTGVLARFDPGTGELVAEIELPPSSTFLSVGPDAVWVMDQRGRVSKVDPETNEVSATIDANPLGIIGGDIVATADAVWLQATSRLAVEIDPATNAVVQRLLPAEGSGSVAVTADGAVWITAHDVLKLYRIPPG